MKRKLFSIILPLGAVIIGFASGVFLTARGYEKFVIAPVRYEKAHVAAIRIGNLSQLRLGETEAAIKSLEEALDAETLVLTQSSKNPKDLPEDVVRVLKQIKTYRRLYPSESTNSSQIEESLRMIPELTDYKKECQASFCRLLESHKAQPHQNSPTEAETTRH